MKRVFHPTLNSWNDVPDDDVAKWVEAGWSKTLPAHVTVSDDTPEPGDHPGIARVSTLEPPEPATTPRAVKATAPKTSTASGRGKAGTGTGSTTTGGTPAR